MGRSGLTTRQREVLSALTAKGGSVTGRFEVEGRPVREDTWKELEVRGLVVIRSGGVTTTCPRTGLGVFTPGPSTMVLTDAGRAALGALARNEVG